MHVAPPDRDSLFHRVNHERVEHRALALDLREARVSPVLALDELQKLHQPLLQDVELVQEGLNVELEVPVLSDPRFAIREFSNVELDVSHRVKRPRNFRGMVHQPLMVPCAPRRLAEWGRWA